MAADTIITKMQNGNVLVSKGLRQMSFPPDMQTIQNITSCQVRDKSGSRQHVFEVDEVIKVVRRDGTEIPITDVATLFFELSTFFFFKLGGGGGSNHLGVFINYTDLITQYPTAGTGDLAYVENSQGTFWLPGGMGGNFYSKGVYMYNGANWDSSVDEIAKQLEENTNDIMSLQTALTNHVNDLANPHDTTIANLDDTTITNPLNGEIIKYSGGAWINTSASSTTSTSLILGGARKKKTTNSYLEIDGLMSNIVPIELHEDSVLDSIIIGTDGNESWTAEIHGNGALIAGGILNIIAGSNKTVTSLGINVLKGVKISLYCNGVNIERPRITTIFKNI